MLCKNCVICKKYLQNHSSMGKKVRQSCLAVPINIESCAYSSKPIVYSW
jgi:hypothetical protein